MIGPWENDFIKSEYAVRATRHELRACRFSHRAFLA